MPRLDNVAVDLTEVQLANDVYFLAACLLSLFTEGFVGSIELTYVYSILFICGSETKYKEVLMVCC